MPISGVTVTVSWALGLRLPLSSTFFAVSFAASVAVLVRREDETIAQSRVNREAHVIAGHRPPRLPPRGGVPAVGDRTKSVRERRFDARAQASGVEANDSEGRDARAVGFGPRT